MNKQELIEKINNERLSPFDDFARGHNSGLDDAIDIIEEFDDSEQQTENKKDLSYLKDYETLECVYSTIAGFNVGDKYPIISVYNEYIEVLKDSEKYTFSYLDKPYLKLKPINPKTTTKNTTNIIPPINTPPHYQGTIQPIDLINAQDLNFNLGNVVKYVCRAGKKQGENILTDLEKAKDYINFEIERVKK